MGFMSTKTKIMLAKSRDRAIKKYSTKYKLEIPLIRAIIQKESSNDFFAPPRYEPHLKKAGWFRKTLTGIDYVEDYHYCSFGMMQILFGTARWNGYRGTPFALTNPDKGIKFGCKFLRKCIKRYKGNIWDGVAAYNQGNNRFYDLNKNGIKDANEDYHNQRYVDAVILFYKTFGETI